MEKVVQVVVQDKKGRFGVVVNADGQAALPTCVVDVGGAFGKAALLIEAPIKVRPAAHLGFDPEVAQHYYLCDMPEAESALGIEWKTASDILKQPLHVSFAPVRNYLKVIAATREVA